MANKGLPSLVLWLVGGSLVLVPIVWALLPSEPVIPDASPPDTDPPPDVAPPPSDAEPHGHDTHGHGHAAPPPLDWSPELDARAAAILEEQGLAYRVSCTPESADFDPGSIAEILEDTFILPPVDLEGGGFRLEVTEKTGLTGLHVHGDTRGLVRWDVDAGTCTAGPVPARRIVDTIPDWSPDMEAWICDTTLDVADDGSVDQQVPGSHKVRLVEGALSCPLGVRRDGEMLFHGVVAMQGEGAGTITWLDDLRPEDATEAADRAMDEVDALDARIAAVEAGESPVDALYGRRLDGLRVLAEADPELAAALQGRIAHIESEYAENREVYRAFLEEQVEAAEAAEDEAVEAESVEAEAPE